MRTARSILCMLLFLTASLSPMAMATDSTVGVNTVWDSDRTLTGNVTVASGATLTVGSDVEVDARSFSITVEGTLIVNDATFYSSVQPLTQGSHGQGLWPGLMVTSTGQATLLNTTVANASSGVTVYGQLSATGLTVNDAYRGVSSMGGSTQLNELALHRIDYEALYVQAGALSVSDMVANEVAVGVESWVDMSGSNLTVEEAGVGLRAQQGRMTVDQVALQNVSVGASTTSQSNMVLTNSSGTNLGLALDASGAAGLEVAHAQFSGDRMMVGQAVQSVNLHNLSFTAPVDEERFLVDLACVGTCIYDNVTVTGGTKALAMSGAGTHRSASMTVDTSNIGLDITGLGHASMDNLTVHAGRTGISMSTPTSDFGSVHVFMSHAQSVGVDLLGGAHNFDSLTVEKPFASGDGTSVGLSAWYANVTANNITVRNVSTGVFLENSGMAAYGVEANVGQATGIRLANSHAHVRDVVTVAQREGVLMEGASHFQVHEWRANLHETPLMIGSSSTAIVRSFLPQNTATSSSDALGDGTLYYGSSASVTVSTSLSYRFVETPVTFTDLQGSPVQADVFVHGFELMSNINGALTVPLLESGSDVDVTLLGSGVRTTLFGGQAGQSVQIPVIPTGDWTVSAGQSIVLGPRPDGQHHTLNGDLTIANNARLSVQSTALIVASGHTVTIQGSGVIDGNDAVLRTDLVQSSGQGLLTGPSTGSTTMTVDGDIEWACQSERSPIRLIISGNLTVQPGCLISLSEGDATRNVVVRTGGQFTTRSSLNVQVLDKGVPVQGVLISVDGATGQTDTNGQLSTSGVARTVDDTSSSYSGLKTVTMQRGSTSDFIMWNTNQSLDHTFMSSTVVSGDVDEWVNLERQWSPYTLNASLRLGSSATMTVQDGVSLRIAEGASITVDGVLDIGAATVSSTGSGARWGGLISGAASGSLIDLSGTTLVEASPTLTVTGSGDVVADGVLFARSGSEALLTVNPASQAELVIRNSIFQDGGDGCINIYPSAGEVSMSNVTFMSCYGSAIWAQQVPLALANLTLLGGVEEGLEFTGVSGTVNGVDAHEFDGEGAIVSLESMTRGFILSNVHGNVTGSGGLVGNNNRDLDIRHVHLLGAPGIDMDASSGSIADVTLQGRGSGTGFISHHGRSSASLVVERLNLSNYAVGIGLHVDANELAAPLVVRDSSIEANSSVASEGFPARFESTTLLGTVELYGATMELVDGRVGEVQATENSTMTAVRTFTLDAIRQGQPVHATFTVQFPNLSLDTLVVSGITVDAPIPYRTVSSTGETVLAGLTVMAEVNGSPSSSVIIDSPSSAATYIAVQIITNQAPNVTLTEPSSGQRVMETDFIRAVAEATDDLDSLENLTFTWAVSDAQGREVLTAVNDRVFNITDLSAGYYVVEVTATDRFGASSTAARDFEYTLLDTDDDWTSTCSSDTWFDPQTGASCGPNLYDEDDDNDGFSDSRDAFPLDPCAQKDTDGDTQPDVLNCPEGFTSWLTEDQDDDGNGVPDDAEGEATSSGSTNLNALMVVVVGLLVVVGLFFMRLRGGGSGGLLTLDERHL